jgi:two-component system cell cycle response regulator DivK
MAKTILLVEDNNIRKLLTGSLKEAGYAVVEAPDGRQGLEWARSVPVDLILLDMMLPVLSGYDVLNGLKANPATASIPVIGISARTMPEDVELACELGVSAYITKPFRLAEVLHTIAAYL